MYLSTNHKLSLKLLHVKKLKCVYTHVTNANEEGVMCGCIFLVNYMISQPKWLVIFEISSSPSKRQHIFPKLFKLSPPGFIMCVNPMSIMSFKLFTRNHPFRDTYLIVHVIVKLLIL